MLLYVWWGTIPLNYCGGFKMRYWTTLLLQGLQNYQRSKLEIWKKIWNFWTIWALCYACAGMLIRFSSFFRTSNFDLWQFCSPLSYNYSIMVYSITIGSLEWCPFSSQQRSSTFKVWYAFSNTPNLLYKIVSSPNNQNVIGL